MLSPVVSRTRDGSSRIDGPKVSEFAFALATRDSITGHRVDSSTVRLSRSGIRFRVFGASSPKGATLFLPRLRSAFPHVSDPRCHDRGSPCGISTFLPASALASVHPKMLFRVIGFRLGFAALPVRSLGEWLRLGRFTLYSIRSSSVVRPVNGASSIRIDTYPRARSTSISVDRAAFRSCDLRLPAQRGPIEICHSQSE